MRQRIYLNHGKISNIYRKKLGNRWRSSDGYGDLVFTSTLGSPVTRYVLTHDINRVVSNINNKILHGEIKNEFGVNNFDAISPHTFRHTFATRCFEKGLSPIFIQSIMGHSNYSTTLSYTHLLKDEQTKELDKINGGFLI